MHPYIIEHGSLDELHVGPGVSAVEIDPRGAPWSSQRLLHGGPFALARSADPDPSEDHPPQAAYRLGLG
jgi:hypothetical protein